MRRYVVVALWLLTGSFWGCAEPTGGSAGTATTTTATPQAAGVQPAAAGPARLVDGTPATGYWNKSQVEMWLTEQLKLTTLNLQSSGEHNYIGVGVNTQGESLKLTVRQVPGGINCAFDNGRGGSGNVGFGNPVN